MNPRHNIAFPLTLILTLILLQSCVSMSARNLGTGKNVTITRDELKSKETKAYAADIEKAEPQPQQKSIMVKVLLAKTSGEITVTSDAEASATGTSVAGSKKLIITAMPNDDISVNSTDTGRKKG